MIIGVAGIVFIILCLWRLYRAVKAARCETFLNGLAFATIFLVIVSTFNSTRGGIGIVGAIIIALLGLLPYGLGALFDVRITPPIKMTGGRYFFAVLAMLISVLLVSMSTNFNRILPVLFGSSIVGIAGIFVHKPFARAWYVIANVLLLGLAAFKVTNGNEDRDYEYDRSDAYESMHDVNEDVIETNDCSDSVNNNFHLKSSNTTSEYDRFDVHDEFVDNNSDLSAENTEPFTNYNLGVENNSFDMATVVDGDPSYIMSNTLDFAGNNINTTINIPEFNNNPYMLLTNSQPLDCDLRFRDADGHELFSMVNGTISDDKNLSFGTWEYCDDGSMCLKNHAGMPLESVDSNGHVYEGSLENGRYVGHIQNNAEGMLEEFRDSSGALIYQRIGNNYFDAHHKRIGSVLRVDQ